MEEKQIGRPLELEKEQGSNECTKVRSLTDNQNIRDEEFVSRTAS